MQKLSNRVIDLEKEKEAHKQYKPYYKKREDSSQPKPPPHSPSAMNLTDVGMDNFCTFHQQPHSKKNLPQWINSMTLVMNRLLDSKLIETGEEKEKYYEPTETQEEDALVLRDYVSMFNMEDEDLPDKEETPETNVTTRSQNPLKEDNSILPKIKKLQENMKNVKNNNSTANIPKFLISS